MSRNRTWTTSSSIFFLISVDMRGSEEGDSLKRLQGYIEKKKKTPNPPTPRGRGASPWQALTCLAVAKAKEERLTPNVEVRWQRSKLAAQSGIQDLASGIALIISARARRRFFRSADRPVTDPS